MGDNSLETERTELYFPAAKTVCTGFAELAMDARSILAFQWQALIFVSPIVGAYWFRPCECARGGMPRTVRWPR